MIPGQKLPKSFASVKIFVPGIETYYVGMAVGSVDQDMLSIACPHPIGSGWNSCWMHLKQPKKLLIETLVRILCKYASEH